MLTLLIMDWKVIIRIYGHVKPYNTTKFEQNDKKEGKGCRISYLPKQKTLNVYYAKLYILSCITYIYLFSDHYNSDLADLCST